MKKSALIIVDMLNDFIDAKGVLYSGQGARDIIPFIGKRLQAYREACNSVIYLQDAHAIDDLEFEKFPPHCVAGTWGSRTIDELAPQNGDIVIHKTRYSGFYGTDLDKILAENKPEVVEIVGVCTSICIMDTVGGLANRDYRTVVPRAGVADFDADAHNQALSRMERLYGATIQ